MPRRRIIRSFILLGVVAAAVAIMVRFWPANVAGRAARILDGVRTGRDSESTSASFSAVAQGDSPAIRKLEALGPEVIPILQQALKDPSLEVRMCAAWTLSRFDDAGLVDLLSGAKAEEIVPLTAGISRHQRLANAVAAAAKDGEPHVRRRAVSALAHAGRKDSLSVLASALHDSDPEVGKTAAYGLVGIGTPEAVEVLAGALSGPNELSVAFSLAMLRDRRAVPALLKGWKQEGMSYALLRLLADMKDERAVDVFREALGSPKADFRTLAATALIAIRSRELELPKTSEVDP